MCWSIGEVVHGDYSRCKEPRAGDVLAVNLLLVGNGPGDVEVSEHGQDGREQGYGAQRPCPAGFAKPGSLPVNVEPRNLPVVVNPHGGPWHRDSWGFVPDVQFLSNRGYAVLQVNFRGSTGFGKEFLRAGDREWGRNMQNDLCS